MRIKSIAAVGAIAAGMGLAGVISAGTASAAECNTLTTPLAQRLACLAEANAATFASTIDPAANIDVFLNGTGEGADNDGLGIKDQPKTFVNSLKDFASGPVAP